MIRNLKFVIPSFLLATALIGCGPQEAQESPGLRDAMTKPPKFDINNVPPQNRDIVRAMTSGRNKPSGAGAPGGTPPSTPPQQPSGN